MAGQGVGWGLRQELVRSDWPQETRHTGGHWGLTAGWIPSEDRLVMTVKTQLEVFASSSRV